MLTTGRFYVDEQTDIMFNHILATIDIPEEEMIRAITEIAMEAIGAQYYEDVADYLHFEYGYDYLEVFDEED